MKTGEKGYTFVELLVVTTILAFIANGAMLSTFYILGNSERDRNQMTTVSQLENAGYWINLDAQRAQTVEAEGLTSEETEFIISWEQYESGDLEETDQYADTLYYAFSNDGGNSWGDWETAFTGDNPSSSFNDTITGLYLTDSFKVRFYLIGPDGWIGTGPDECAYLDNISINEAFFADDCSSLAGWDDSANWVVSSGRFRGHDSGGNRYLPMSTSLDLSNYQAETVTVSWEQTEVGYLESSDGLYFSFSSDNGSSWSSDIEAFHDDSPPYNFSYTIPQEYLTANFKLRFYLDYFGASDEYLYIDDIAISVPMFSDDCSDFGNWDNGSDWDVYSGEFRGHHYGGGDAERYLTMSNTLDLTPTVFGAGFPLTFTWTTWNETGGTEYQATYTIVGDLMMRSYSVDGGAPIQTHVAQYIDPYNSYCQFTNGRLTFTLTANAGGGPSEVNELRQFQVLTRPDDSA